MATVNIGSLKFNWKGTYNGSTAYAIDDVTEYNGSSYICILASTGNLPTNTTYFQPMATKGTDLSTTLTTQGDIVYRDGSGLQRLGAGTSGQFLKTLGTGANPVWGDSGGGILQAKFTTVSSEIGVSTSGNPSTNFANMTALSGMTVTITPASTSNKILVFTNFTAHHNTSGQGIGGIKNTTDTRYSGIVGDFYHNAGGGVAGNINIWWLETPTTTNATTYQAYYTKTHAGTDYINRDYHSNNNGKAIIGAFEISSTIL